MYIIDEEFISTVAKLRGRADSAEDARRLEDVAHAIGTTRFMDPPDGGDPSLAEQVSRMHTALDKAEALCKTLAEALERLVDKDGGALSADDFTSGRAAIAAYREEGK
jgi:hypothetical protein